MGVREQLDCEPAGRSAVAVHTVRAESCIPKR